MHYDTRHIILAIGLCCAAFNRYASGTRSRKYFIILNYKISNCSAERIALSVVHTNWSISSFRMHYTIKCSQPNECDEWHLNGLAECECLCMTKTKLDSQTWWKSNLDTRQNGKQSRMRWKIKIIEKDAHAKRNEIKTEHTIPWDGKQCSICVRDFSIRVSLLWCIRVEKRQWWKNWNTRLNERLYRWLWLRYHFELNKIELMGYQTSRTIECT